MQWDVLDIFKGGEADWPIVKFTGMTGRTSASLHYLVLVSYVCFKVSLC